MNKNNAYQKHVRPVCCKKLKKKYIDFFLFKSRMIYNPFRDNYKVQSLN